MRYVFYRGETLNTNLAFYIRSHCVSCHLSQTALVHLFNREFSLTTFYCIYRKQSCYAAVANSKFRGAWQTASSERCSETLAGASAKPSPETLFSLHTWFNSEAFLRGQTNSRVCSDSSWGSSQPVQTGRGLALNVCLWVEAL